MTHRAISLTAVGLLLLLGAPLACGDSTDGPDNVGGSAGESGNGSAGEPAAGSGGTTSAAGMPSGGVPAEGGAPITEGGAPIAEGGAPTSGVCGAVEKQEELAAGLHSLECAELTWATNPPSSGEHYPVWAAYGEYDFALPRGYWVHNLEHGSVVVTYNCPEGCDEDLAAARAWLATLEADALCTPGPARVLLVPDPLLDVQWAASAWGYTLRANCFDAGTFSAFYTAHVGQPPAPEATICTSGNVIASDSCAE